MMRVGSLFSGIGGLDLGLVWAGMHIVWQSEVDPYASAVLRHHWPDVPNVGDIKAIDPTALPPVDLVCGGYPCQPFSNAGKRQGQADDRCLWPYMRQVLAALRPAWCLCENVAGHVSMGLDDVLSDLARLGYACWPLVIPACAVDSPHRRDRVWILAHADLFHGDGGGHGTGAIRRQRETPTTLPAGEAPADTDRPGLEGRVRQGLPQCPPERHAGKGGASFTDTDGQHAGRIAESRQEYCQWQPEPGVGRVAHGIPCRMDRLKALGNAVVPQVAYEIGRAIMAAQREAA